MITGIEGAIGNQLCGVARSTDGSKMLLVFDDGIKCQLAIDLGHDPGDEEIVDNLDFDSWEYWAEELLEAGAVDAEFFVERERLANEKRQLAKERQEAEDKREYERLKKKFGSA